MQKLVYICLKFATNKKDLFIIYLCICIIMCYFVKLK